MRQPNKLWKKIFRYFLKPRNMNKDVKTIPNKTPIITMKKTLLTLDDFSVTCCCETATATVVSFFAVSCVVVTALCFSIRWIVLIRPRDTIGTPAITIVSFIVSASISMTVASVFVESTTSRWFSNCCDIYIESLRTKLLCTCLLVLQAQSKYISMSAKSFILKKRWAKPCFATPLATVKDYTNVSI